MQCIFCQYDIPAQDIELSQRLAKCRSCNQVFVIDLPTPITTIQPAMTATASLPSRPEKLRIVDENGQGYMQWRWFHPMAFGLLFFCIAWDSFLIFWYSSALFGMGGNGAPAPFHWLSIIFPIGHVAIGVGLTYYTLCLFLNKTQIIYDGTYVIFRSGPIPTFRNRSFTSEEIRRLESESRFQSGKSGGQTIYQLFVVLADNTRKPLISYETDPALVRYVQRQLESWLGLPPGSPLLTHRGEGTGLGAS